MSKRPVPYAAYQKRGQIIEALELGQQRLEQRIAELEQALQKAPDCILSADKPGWADLPKREHYVYWFYNTRRKALENTHDSA